MAADELRNPDPPPIVLGIEKSRLTSPAIVISNFSISMLLLKDRIPGRISGNSPAARESRLC
jgi:hypothetical protein